MAHTRPTYLYAIIGVALVLIVLGFFALTALHLTQLTNLYKEKVDIWLELKPELAAGEIERVSNSIRQHPAVKAETLKFITKEQVAADMTADLGEESMLEEMPDLLRDVLRFNVHAEYLDQSSLNSWRAQLREDPAVADLYFEASNLGNVHDNIKNLGWITLGLSILLIFAAVTLIHNTIRLALYANRFLIKNQQLVGASWGFISKPYVQRGILNGLISAGIAIAVLAAFYWWICKLVPDIRDLITSGELLLFYVVLLLLGALISGISSWFVVNKFLRMQLDDLY
jgi:cell division transport system permease protein